MIEGPRVIGSPMRKRKSAVAIPPGMTYDEFRMADPKVRRLTDQRNALDERLRLLWAEYRHRAGELQRKIAYVDRELRAEDTYVRARYTSALALAQSPSAKPTIQPSENAQPTTQQST